MAGPVHTVSNTWFADRDALQKKENKAGETLISSFDYGVNAIGQRSGVATSGTAFANNPNWAWGYDALGQVTKADNNGNNVSDRAYEYDTIGNRKKSAESLTLPTDDNYTANALNQYSSITLQQSTINLIYDLDGNMTSGPVQPEGTGSPQSCAFTWDAENRLASTAVNGVTTIYLYDSQSRRVAKKSGLNGTVCLYDGWNRVSEYSLSDSQTFDLRRTYVWGLDRSGSIQGASGVSGLLALTLNSQPSTPTLFSCYEGNGSVSEYLNAAGMIVAHFEYDPFGRVLETPLLPNENLALNTYLDIRFSTKPQDEETGMLYYGYRYYNHSVGTWASRDPIHENGGLDLYDFLNNDAVNNIDLVGLIKDASLIRDGDPCEKCCERCQGSGEFKPEIQDDGTKDHLVKAKVRTPTFANKFIKDHVPNGKEDCCAVQYRWTTCYTGLCAEITGVTFEKTIKPLPGAPAWTALAVRINGSKICSCENGKWKCISKLYDDSAGASNYLLYGLDQTSNPTTAKWTLKSPNIPQNQK